MKTKGKLLSGSELAGFIKQRQLTQVRQLTPKLGSNPKLAILLTVNEPSINTYVAIKQSYGKDIGIEVEKMKVDQNQLQRKIEELNVDNSVNAIIVQLPLDDISQTDQVLNIVDPVKDVDGLGNNSKFDSATATAIMWLLAGYNLDIRGKNIVVVGQGRLVGKPTADYLDETGHLVTRCDRDTTDLQAKIEQAEVVISGVGQPGLIKSGWLQPGTIVIDAGTSGEKGELKGDVQETATARDDLIITPLKGGIGPLTVCALFDNVIKAATHQVQ